MKGRFAISNLDLVQYAPQGGLGSMSRDGDSGSMASRRRVWYYEDRRHLQREDEQTYAQATPVGASPRISTSRGDLTSHSEVCYNSHCHEQ